VAEKESTAAELRESLWRTRSERRTTLDLVAGLDDGRAQRTPAGGGWSVAQVIEHLIKTDGVYRAWIGRLIELKAAGREPVVEVSLRELQTRPFFVPAALLPQMDFPFRLMNRFMPSSLRESLTGTAIIPFEAPEAAAPGSARPLEDLRHQGAASAEQVETMLLGQDVSGMILDHPLLGRHTVPSLLRMLVRHENRHQAQISRILAAEAMPAAAPVMRPAESTATHASSTAGGDRRLAEFAHDAERALKSGRQIVSWWRDKTLLGELKLFPMKTAEEPHYEMQGFFDSILMIGDMKPTPIMGCLQRLRFKRRRPPVPEATRHLESFIDQHFLAKCLRTRPDGSPGGFRYRPICVKHKDGRLVEPEDPQAHGADLAGFRHGPQGVLQVDILDFVRVNPMLAQYDGVLSRFIRESAYVVIHEDLAVAPTDTPKGVIAERVFGYAFLPRAVEHNMFGFGPGKFTAAIKQWRFLLFLNGDVEVHVSFLVTRSQKVLEIGGFDPIYASLHLADAFSLGALGLRQRGHDAMDRIFLEHHGAVHADVVMGLQEIWEGQRWAPAIGTW
jgi:hypothetical protein